jgi:hypothetical protein
MAYRRPFRLLHGVAEDLSPALGRSRDFGRSRSGDRQGAILGCPGWTGTEAKFYLFISVLAASFGGVKAGMLGTASSQGGTPPQPETG